MLCRARSFEIVFSAFICSFAERTLFHTLMSSNQLYLFHAQTWIICNHYCIHVFTMLVPFLCNKRNDYKNKQTRIYKTLNICFKMYQLVFTMIIILKSSKVQVKCQCICSCLRIMPSFQSKVQETDEIKLKTVQQMSIEINQHWVSVVWSKFS